MGRLQTVTMARLTQRPDRYLHSPRLLSAAHGGARLRLIAWHPQTNEEQLLEVDVSPSLVLGEARVCERHAAIVALTRGDEVQVSHDARAELHETRALEEVSIAYAEGVSEVRLRRPEQPECLVWRAQGIAAAPTLMPTATGTWVAFHHDVREDTGVSDVSKWVAVRFVDRDGQVFEPSATMTERSRDREGVEQSFEFPALVVGREGAVTLFGRGSHNYFRQDLNEQGFTARIALSDGEWGSRGRHIAALALENGIVIARRERQGIEVDLLPPVEGKVPALAPAIVDLTVRGLVPSAYVIDRARDPAQRHGCITLFGDIQQHSAHSDGIGSAEEAYLRARHRYADDFVALTDHESFLGKRTAPGEWEYLQQVAERHDAPRTFATLFSYEWTGKAFPGPGHKCVYLPVRGLPIVSRDDVPDGKLLVQRVRALGGFASPHHIGWTGADEAGHDDVGQPLWEICSCHGCYEHVDHPLGQRGSLRDQMADAALRRGLRFGFTGSSDSHGLLWHHGEARNRDPYRTGLTAVQAKECTREALMAALVQRRCYATSGAKILLDVTADGAAMGSELADRTQAEFEVAAIGTDTIEAIELVTDQGVVARVTPQCREGRLRATAGGRFAYARVVQRDGEMAWSSPIFLE